MANAALSFLGLCRKAGRLAIGHDAAVDTLVRHRSKLVLLASDGSPRLAQEARRLCERHGVPLLRTPYTMREYEAAIGNKGQNVRLAARLTGWKIDIKPESGFYTPHGE